MHPFATQTATPMATSVRENEGRFVQVDTSLLYEELRRAYHSSKAPLEVDMRQLVSWLKAGDQATHLIHPYPGKLLPHIAHFFVHASLLNKAKKPILDPFCGSGTVALEASLAGIESFVADANPFAVLLAAVKSQPFEISLLREELLALVRRARSYRSAARIKIVNSTKWYHPEIKIKLERVLRAVAAIKDEKVRAFFLIVFSATAKKLSYSDPAISVPVRLRVKPQFSVAENRRIQEKIATIESADAILEFQSQALLSIERVHRANSQQHARKAVSVVGVDCKSLHAPGSASEPLPSESITLTITSPPYGSAQKYIRATSFGLNWIGFANPDELASLEAKSIGREHVKVKSETTVNVAPKLSAQLERIRKKNPLRARITWEYLHDMRQCVTELCRVTAPGGTVVIVVGNNQVAGEEIQNDAFLIEEFKSNGMELDLWLLDRIRARRLMRSRHPTASMIDYESILVFRK